MIFISTYIPFTEAQKEQAVSVDLEAFLERRGERLLRSGREKRLASNHSITIRGSEWYDHAEERGGNAVSFVQRFYNLSFPEAMQLLLGCEVSSMPRSKSKPNPFTLPKKHSDMRRVFAYLTQTRGVSNAVVAAFAHERLLYEDAEHHNAVFLGLNESGTARHAHIRSTNSGGPPFRLNIEGSDARYSFHRIGSNGSLFVFEAPVDLLSHISLYSEDWQANSYVACCGTSIRPVLKMLEMMPSAETIYLCQDNDATGARTAERMAEHLAGLGLNVVRQISQGKDWNNDLRLQL